MTKDFWDLVFEQWLKGYFHPITKWEIWEPLIGKQFLTKTCNFVRSTLRVCRWSATDLDQVLYLHGTGTRSVIEHYVTPGDWVGFTEAGPLRGRLLDDWACAYIQHCYILVTMPKDNHIFLPNRTREINNVMQFTLQYIYIYKHTYILYIYTYIHSCIIFGTGQIHLPQNKHLKYPISTQRQTTLCTQLKLRQSKWTIYCSSFPKVSQLGPINDKRLLQ